MSKELFFQQRELELINDFPVSKAAIQQKASEAVEIILESGDPIQFAQAFSSVEQFVAAVKKDERFVNYVREKLGGDKGKAELPTGTKIEACEVGSKYDYSHDDEWTMLEAAIRPMREKQKEREDFLKKIPPGKQLIEDGVILGTGPAKSSTSSFKVTLAK